MNEIVLVKVNLYDIVSYGSLLLHLSKQDDETMDFAAV